MNKVRNRHSLAGIPACQHLAETYGTKAVSCKGVVEGEVGRPLHIYEGVIKIQENRSNLRTRNIHHCLTPELE